MIAAERRKFLGQFIMAIAVMICLINVVLYAKGRGNPALVASGASLLVLAVIVLAGAKKAKP